MTPEFSHLVDAGTISETPKRIEIGADETERRCLAGRFRLQALDRLSASVTLTRRAGIIHAEGVVDAALVQSCVVTSEAMPAKLNAPFAVRFVPDAYAGATEEEVELSAQDCDTLPIENGQIDLGELAAETLALALDPFPRSEMADAALEELGVAGKAEAGPFAGLKALKDQLDKGS